jgi:hypothetical protein
MRSGHEIPKPEAFGCFQTSFFGFRGALARKQAGNGRFSARKRQCCSNATAFKNDRIAADNSRK